MSCITILCQPVLSLDFLCLNSVSTVIENDGENQIYLVASQFVQSENFPLFGQETGLVR